MRYPYLLLAALLCTFLAPGLVARAAAAAEDPIDPKTVYRLRPSDEVAIAVRPRKEFDCSGVILPDGSLTLINIGQIRAGGLSLTELGDRVKAILSQKLRKPEVTVSLTRMAPPDVAPVVKKNRITIVGAVRTVGPQELEEGLRVRKALDLAGGAVETADLKHVSILHQDLTRIIVDLSTPAQVSDPNHNQLLRDGDSIEVPHLPDTEKPVARTGMVRIDGLVGTPGQYELKPGMTLQDLIIAAGRLSPLADVENVQLQHRGQPVETIDLPKRLDMGLKGKILLEPGDEAFVPEQKNRIILIGTFPDPGAKVLTPGETLRQFFLNGQKDTAAALNPGTTDLKHVELIRPGKEPRKLDLGSVLKKADHKDNIQLAAGDVLFLPPKVAKTKRGPLDFLSNLGPIGMLMGLF